MFFDFNEEQPIYLQIAEKIEDGILQEIWAEDSQVPSTTELSVTAKINPATARKGMNLLVDEGILYKKRGVGMFVAIGARKKILAKRKQNFYQDFVSTLLAEAKKLNISKQELISMIEGSGENG